MLFVRNRIILPWVLLTLTTINVGAEQRTWTSVDGQFRVVAELVSVENGLVTLRREDGKTARVPLERLSTRDQQFVQRQTANLSKPRDAERFKYLVLRNLSTPVDDTKQELRATLPRELVRQALLLVAREDLGMGTRDETIREAPTRREAANALTLYITVRAGTDGILRTRIWTDAARTEAAVWSDDVPYSLDALEMYPSILQHLTGDTRPKLRDLLVRLGCTPIDRSQRSAIASATMHIEESLLIVDVVPQFATIRQAHHAYAQGEATDDALGHLVRGYANLSSLTEQYWTATSQAFAARSMLYAELLLKQSQDRSVALANRAYARALTGQHSAALEDLAAARQGDAKLPYWAALIEPCAKCDVDELYAAAKDMQGILPFAEWLALQVAIGGMDELAIDKSLKRMVDAGRMPVPAFAFFVSASLAHQRWAAVAGPQMFRSALEGYLPTIPELATDLVKRIDWSDEDESYAIAAEVIRTLPQLDAGEGIAEPSWSLFTALLQDQFLVLVAADLFNASNATQTPLGPFVQRMLPTLSDHPFAPFIESFSVDRKEEYDQYVRILDKLRFVDPQPHLLPVMRRLRQVETPTYGNLAVAMQARMGVEYTFQSLRRRIDYGFPSVEAQQEFTRGLARVAPYSPLVQRAQLATNNDATDDELKAWEKDNWNEPAAMEQLGGRYERLNRIDDAKRVYARALELGPNANRCLFLGSLYWRTDDVAAWKTTLEGFVENAGPGLDRARVQSELALGLMALERWKEAEPHAVAAAESYSSWGLDTASQCLEGLKKWNESEAYVKAVGEGYGGAHRLKWYLWCQRTGQGNLAAARDDARSFFATPANPRDLARIGYQAVFQELEGNLPEAIAAYEQGIALRSSLWWSIHVAILAKEANDVEAFNRAIAYLRKLAASAEEARTEHRQRLAALVVAELAPKAGEQPASLDDMQKLLDDSPDRNTKVDLRYFLGSLLQLRGEPDEAKKYWQAAVDRGPFDRPSCTLAGFRLRQVGK